MKVKMTKTKKALGYPSPVAFTVELWRDDSFNGDEKVSVVKRETIEDSFSAAIKESEDKKRRYDVVYVTAHLRTGKNIELPKRYWEHLVR